MYDKVGLGNRIYIARKDKNIKQCVLSQYLGLGQSRFSDIENGKRELSIDELYKIAEVLNVSVTWLLGEQENNFTEKESLEIEKYKSYIKSLRK
jgi:transcriptional regulator with XRE-family HTH domain